MHARGEMKFPSEDLYEWADELEEYRNFDKWVDKGLLRDELVTLARRIGRAERHIDNRLRVLEGDNHADVVYRAKMREREHTLKILEDCNYDGREAARILALERKR